MLDPVIVVTGLPRSGTSLMMQILRAGGVPLLADERRPADVNNPHGFYECEKVKHLAADNGWLAEACGKAVKVVAPLVSYLPAGFTYRAIVMDRDISEVMQSQARMTQNLGTSVIGVDDAVRQFFERSLAIAYEFFRRQPQAATLTVSYRELTVSPDTAIDRIAAFLGHPNIDRSAMAGVIDAKLYRSRAGGGDCDNSPSTA